MATDIVCDRCGTSDKRPNGVCRQCAINWSRKYRERHAEKLAEKRAQKKQEASEYAKAYYRKHSDKLKAKAAQRLADNREQINAIERARYNPDEHWRKRNPDRHKAAVKAYLAENANKRAIYEANRRARRAEGGKLPSDTKETLFQLQRGRCAICTEKLNADCHLDHIQPLSKGGENTFLNVQLLCQPCNLAKNSKHPIDFMQSRGYLL